MGAKVIKKVLFIFATALQSLLPTLSLAGPVERRALIVEATSTQDINQQTLRFKLIRSRALLIYLSDVLPGKGSPYEHATDFVQQLTLKAFKVAQKNQKQMDHILWLPYFEKNQHILDPDLLAVYRYAARYAAAVEVMSEVIEPTLEKNVVISPLKNNVTASVAQKFSKAWNHVQYIKSIYKRRLNAHFQPQPIQVLFSEEQKIIILELSSHIAKAMAPYLEQVSNKKNRMALRRFVEHVTDLNKLKVTPAELAETKAAILKITKTKEFKVAAKVLTSVDLPDSGDIDGADQSFEVVTRLEVGFEVLLALLAEAQKW
jgi:hypothetical protein